MTYTYAILEISKQAYKEISRLLKTAGYDQAFHEHAKHGVVIDMHGIALARNLSGNRKPRIDRKDHGLTAYKKGRCRCPDCKKLSAQAKKLWRAQTGKH